jgi:hypothetical protein
VRALQRAGHRGDAELEHLGDLLRRPAEHVAQEQDRALADRQVLERREERELDRLPPRDQLLGIEQRVRHRRQPRQLGPQRWCGARLVIGGDGADDVHRQHAGGPLGERVEADVRRDPVQPRRQLRAAVERRARSPRAHQRLLHQLLGLVGRAGHPVAVPAQRAAVRLARGGERVIGHCTASWIFGNGQRAHAIFPVLSTRK